MSIEFIESTPTPEEIRDVIQTSWSHAMYDHEDGNLAVDTALMEAFPGWNVVDLLRLARAGAVKN